MALNVAVPLSGLGVLPPISPIEVDCWDNFKILVSPIESESSGVSSLDSDETKLQQIKPSPKKAPKEPRKEHEVYYNGRNILDLFENVNMNPTKWRFRYSHLPEKNNISMFWANRSLYNRLGPNGLTPVYTINKCECCDFQYTSDCPNSYLRETSLVLSLTSSSPMIFSNAPSKKQEFNITKKVSLASVHSSLIQSLGTSQQSLTECQGNEEQICKQFYNDHIANKIKFNDAIKRDNYMPSIDSNFINKNKFSESVSPHKAEMHHLTSNQLSASNALKAPVSNAMDYNNSIINHSNYCDIPTKNSKYHATSQNSLTTQLISTSRPLVTTLSGIQNSLLNVNNSAVSNHNAPNNKSQSSPNNYYSLFNPSTTNNSGIYAVNPSASNNNYYVNSLNSATVNSNMTGNQLTPNSHYYGRMYKYF